MIFMKRKDRCSVCQGRGWTLNGRGEPKPCECRVKAKDENSKRVLLAHGNY